MNFEAGAGVGVLAPEAAALARFNALRALVFLLLLADMVWKPWA
jgi:hypothetical protein